MGDDRRGGGNGAVVAIVVVLGIIMLMGLVLVVGAGMFFFAFEARSVPLSAPAAVPTTSTMPAPVEEMKTADLLEAALEPSPAPAPPLMRIVIKAGEKIEFGGGSGTLADFQARLAEIKERTPNQEIRIHFDSGAEQQSEFIRAVKQALAEAEINYTVEE